MRGRLFQLASLLLCMGTAGAHPHSYVDQQALVSLGPRAVDVTIRIVPSFTEGAAIFAHIDADADGTVTDAEATRFAAAVVAMARLEVDGQGVAFHHVSATIPGIDEVSAGFGIIEVGASAVFTLASSGRHRVVFDISYDEFSRDWQVQPFFYTGFVEAMSSRIIARSKTGNGVAVLFSSPGVSPTNTPP